MYKYIKQWPKDRENGWSHELNGVCHDDDNWYFTQNGKPASLKSKEYGVLWKFPINHRLADKVTTANPAKGILNYDTSKIKGGKKLHYGDLDYYNGYLFVPVTGGGNPFIQVFTAKDLIPVTTQVLKRPDGKYFDSIAWCAINPKDGRLYTSDRHISHNFQSSDKTPFLVYDIDFLKIKERNTNFLTFNTAIIPTTSDGKVLDYDYIQGGCFDFENHLHTTNGSYTGISKKYCNSKGGIFVFQMPNVINKGVIDTAKRIAQSNQSRGFRYQFNGLGDEPEGITYWNLNNDPRASKDIKGVLHAIMINNDDGVTNPDDFYFKHYDRT